jgi:acyl-CoA thioester hydrolase
MERGRTNYLRLLGADQRALFEETEKEAPGFAFVVRSMQIEFLKAARMDDVLEVSQHRMRCAAPRSRSHQRVMRGDDVLIEARVQVAFVSGGRARRIPEARAHRNAGGPQAGVIKRYVLSTTRSAQCKYHSHELET